MTVDREDVTEKATFQKIKEYVKEKYGLIVDTKYIAEVMRKHMDCLCMKYRIKWRVYLW